MHRCFSPYTKLWNLKSRVPNSAAVTASLRVREIIIIIKKEKEKEKRRKKKKKTRGLVSKDEHRRKYSMSCDLLTNLNLMTLIYEWGVWYYLY